MCASASYLGYLLDDGFFTEFLLNIVFTQSSWYMVICPSCKGVIPNALYCPICGYPLYARVHTQYTNQGSDKNHDEVSKSRSLVVKRESNHRLNAILKGVKKKSVGVDSIDEESLIDEHAKAVNDNKETSNILKSDDLDWIKLLKSCNISDEKVKEIKDEWIKLITQIRKLSRIFKNTRAK